MRHPPEIVAELADLRRRARAAAEELIAQHQGALMPREARRIEALLQRPVDQIASRDAEAVLHIAYRIGALS